MYQGPIIDADVHQEWKSQDDLLPYMAEGWRDYVLGPGRAGPVSMDAASGFQNPHGFDRDDAYPDDGNPPGSSPGLFKEQLLDRYKITRAVMTFGDVMGVSDFRNPFFSTEVARAATEWMMDFWLPADDRLYGSLLVANGLPDVAAAQIRKHGDNPRIAQVMICGNGLEVPLGHPLYHPIYEAAEEMNLPVAVHAFWSRPVPAAGGTPNFYIEYHMLAVQPMMTTLISMIAEGVFDKFPNLKVVIEEGGVGWIPPIMWRFDTDYKGLRREIPWVQKLPTEYFRNNIRVTTQPYEVASDPEAMIKSLETIGGEDFLLFATDYPHWDADDPTYVADLLPKAWLPKVFYENGRDTFGWKDELSALEDHRPEEALA